MPDDERKPDSLDECLERIEAGSRAGGARPYLLDYIRSAKSNIFVTLVNTTPTHADLLRVWGAAVGIAEMEKDLEATIQEGKEARVFVRELAPGEPGQAE